MTLLPLTALDDELVAAARAAMAAHYQPFWHTVAAAVRCGDGRIFTGVHLGATVGRLSVCAEAVALGRAIVEGGIEGGVELGRQTPVTMVAVRHPKPDEADRTIAIVSPCGACREMILDHAPGAQIIVPDADGVAVKLAIAELLPLPYRR